METAIGRHRVRRCAALALSAGLGLLAGLAPVFGEPVDPRDDSVWLRDGRLEIQRLIVVESVRSGAVPAPLALAVAGVESGFVAETLGASGKVGVMQLLPSVAVSEFGADAGDLWDPATNVRLGVRYLADLRKRYDGNWRLALSHYRGGTLLRDGDRFQPHDYTHGYVRRVMRCWWHFQRDALTRAWIRELRGTWRLSADERIPFSEDWSAHDLREGCTARAAPQYGNAYRQFLDADGCRSWNPCSEPEVWRDREQHRFVSDGQWKAIRGTTRRGYRWSGNWLPVTGGKRFR